jgi:Flp pilus assembly protein TadG
MQRAAKGQNLIELVMTLGFVLVILYTTIEVGRVWMTYSAAKSAALDGALIACQLKDPVVAKQRIETRLKIANLTPKTVKVQQTGAQKLGYTTEVVVTYQPLFPGLSLPTPAGNIPVIPGQFDVSIQDTKFFGVY